jgi:hypothetical protein
LVLENARLAKKYGCVGVMLIHPDGEGDFLLNRLILPIQEMGLRVGINRLSCIKNPAVAIGENCHLGTDWTWGGYFGVSSIQNNTRMVKSIQSVLKEHPSHLFFGGMVFKYPLVDTNPTRVAQEATRVGIIPTTSAIATDSAPDMAEIKAMSEALGNRKIVLASGVTPENVSSFLPYASAFLVSTGISASYYEFDPAKMKALADLVHQPLPEGAPEDGILLRSR